MALRWALQTTSMCSRKLSIVDVTISKQLQKGAFGVVYRGYDRALGTVAVKVYTRDAVPGSLSLKKLLKLRHPHIVRHHRCAIVDDCNALVMEYAVGGDLFEATDIPASPQRALKYVRDLYQGLRYLHGKNIVHLDVKRENLLVMQDGRLTLADFDFARRRGERLKGRIGTMACWSPEMAAADQRGAMNLLAAEVSMDIWAAGIVVYELMVGYSRSMETAHDYKNLLSFQNPLTDRTGPLANLANAACRLIPETRILETVPHTESQSAEHEHQRQEESHNEQKCKRRRVRSC